MNQTENPLGLYLHIPFCTKKCAYCDFYSCVYTDGMMDKYVSGLTGEIKRQGARLNRAADTVYFGGGTPSLLGRRLVSLLDTVRRSFAVPDGAEITLELNPGAYGADFLETAKKAGINRLSVGVQSGLDRELKTLGRTHTAADARRTVADARAAGFKNISVDLMLGLPGSDEESLSQSLDFITALSPEHISAYILKIEEKTLFYRQRNTLCLPDDDAAAAQYALLCRFLREKGYGHYEISNFCLEGYESQHNLKYWRGEDYLGLGPAAHSLVGGKRFFYPRDLKAFLGGTPPISDGTGGGAEEYIMLRLRLRQGVDYGEYESRFGQDICPKIQNKCQRLEKAGLMRLDRTGFRLTERGMLVSNAIITEILEEV